MATWMTGKPPPLKPHKSRSAPSILPPGPGYYSPAKPTLHSPHANIPKARRWNSDESTPTPGPAQYRKTQVEGILWRQPRQPKFSIVSRGILEAPHKIAGLGSTGLELEEGGPLRPHRGRRPPPSNMTPGPTDYNPAKPNLHKPQARFPQTRRWKRDDDDFTPGPMDYRKTQMKLNLTWKQPRQPRFSTVPRNLLALPDEFGFAANRQPMVRQVIREASLPTSNMVQSLSRPEVSFSLTQQEYSL